jgi:hypothetical protein
MLGLSALGGLELHISVSVSILAALKQLKIGELKVISGKEKKSSDSGFALCGLSTDYLKMK